VTRLAIIGGGSWGTALSIVLAPRFDTVRLWVYETDLARRMAETRENDVFLPGFKLPDAVRPTSQLDEALKDAQVVLTVMPSHHVRAIAGRMLTFLHPGMLLVSATKGIENGSLMRVSEVLAEVIGPKFEPAVAVLSGPTFSGPTFRLYTNNDPVGVEVGAALKNVIAIAAGVCQGLGFGSNAKAALITRGLAEITRLAVAMGGQPLTLSGLAGLGDLVLTCSGDLSRNRTVGIALASGRTLSEILGSMNMVAEGVQTTHAAIDLARKFQVNLPITEQMEAILSGRKSPREALRELMDRSLKGE
jgi:glycerol-3-phosphate dehydrogenase (NAD(P)+)